MSLRARTWSQVGCDRVGAAPSTARETLRRAAIAELSWPLGDDVSDAVLEGALYKAAGTKTGHLRSPEPDWALVHRELKRKHMTLQILWDEYISRGESGSCGSYRRTLAIRPAGDCQEFCAVGRFHQLKNRSPRR